MLTAFGETKSFDDWVDDKRCKVGLYLLKKRIRLGWSVERALTTLMKGNPKIQIRGKKIVSSEIGTTTIASWQIKSFHEIEMKHGIIRFKVKLVNGALIPSGLDRIRPEQIDKHARLRLKKRMIEKGMIEEIQMIKF